MTSSAEAAPSFVQLELKTRLNKTSFTSILNILIPTNIMNFYSIGNTFKDDKILTGYMFPEQIKLRYLPLAKADNIMTLGLGA